MQLSGFSQDALINVNCQQHFLESQEAFSSLLSSPPFPPASLSFTGEGLGGVGCVGEVSEEILIKALFLYN